MQPLHVGWVTMLPPLLGNITINFSSFPHIKPLLNRFGHLGWNQFFNLLKYSPLELQSDRRRLLFKFHTLQCSLKVQRVFLAFTNQLCNQDHVPFPFCLVSKILKCACSRSQTMFFGVWGLHNPPAIPQLLQPPEEPPEAS